MSGSLLPWESSSKIKANRCELRSWPSEKAKDEISQAINKNKKVEKIQKYNKIETFLRSMTFGFLVDIGVETHDFPEKISEGK